MAQVHPEPQISSRNEGRISPAPRFAPPLIAFLLVNIVLFAAAHAEGYPYSTSETWMRWDSLHYVEIAEDGYTAEPCTRFRLFDWVAMRDSLLDSLGFDIEGSDICGNAGWFPGYPAAIKALGITGLSPPVAAVLLATVLQLATLLALWSWFLRRHERLVALSALVAGAFFFGHVYYRAAFPISAVTFLLLLHLKLVLEERWLGAGIAGAAAAFAYPTAFLIAPVTLAWTILRRPRAEALRGATGAAAITAAGFAAVHLIQWRTTNVWLAFFKIQSQFGYGINLPTERLVEVISPLFTEGLSMTTLPSLHTLATTLVVLGLLGLALANWPRLRPEQSWVALAIAAFWLFPLMLGGDTSLYRIHAVLLPLVLLLPRAPKAARYAVPAMCVAFSYPMALLFFRSTLI